MIWKISLTPVARRFLTGLRGQGRETRGQQCGTYRMSGKACPSPLVKDLSSHERLRFPWPRKRRASAGLARTLGAFFRARCASECLSSASQLGKHGNAGRPFVCNIIITTINVAHTPRSTGLLKHFLGKCEEHAVLPVGMCAISGIRPQLCRPSNRVISWLSAGFG